MAGSFMNKRIRDFCGQDITVALYSIRVETLQFPSLFMDFILIKA
jgi:hypothetical protein